MAKTKKRRRAESGDDYAKGWEQGVQFALHVMHTQGTVDDAAAALRMELIKAERMRNAAGRNHRMSLTTAEREALMQRDW